MSDNSHLRKMIAYFPPVTRAPPVARGGGVKTRFSVLEFKFSDSSVRKARV